MNIFTPLHVCLFTLMISSCGGRGGNKWWFGMKTDFCSALLKCIPCLTIYGNIYIGEKVSFIALFCKKYLILSSPNPQQVQAIQTLTTIWA